MVRHFNLMMAALLLLLSLFEASANNSIAQHAKFLASATNSKQDDWSLKVRDVHSSLEFALGISFDFVHDTHLREVQQSLATTWNTLPKNQDGRINRRSLCYLISSYFLKHYKISIVGLSSHRKEANPFEVSLLWTYAPNYIRTVLEGKNAKRGFSLADAVAMVVVVKEVLQHEDLELLEIAYYARSQELLENLNREELWNVIKAYMLRLTLGWDNPETVIHAVENNDTILLSTGTVWTDIFDFARGHIYDFEFKRERHVPTCAMHSASDLIPGVWNPLKPLFAFTDAQFVASSITQSFGNFWELECSRSKELLVQLDPATTGRVKLGDFHAATMAGNQHFGESREYLQQLGALDETSRLQGPRVIITNYLQSTANCVIRAQHYHVCCANECQVYMAVLEQTFGAPEAQPEALWDVVQNLTSDTWGRASELRPRLFDIAQANAGKVPLHGRLFAQWLHYVFPHECPYPHIAGTTKALTPEDFGQAHIASKDEMRKHMTDMIASEASQLGLSPDIAAIGLTESDEPYFAEWLTEQLDINQSLNASAMQEDLDDREVPDWLTQWSPEEELMALHVGPKASRYAPTTKFALIILALCVLSFFARSSATAYRFVRCCSGL